jgi:hypothetical protein
VSFIARRCENAAVAALTDLRDRGADIGHHCPRPKLVIELQREIDDSRTPYC